MTSALDRTRQRGAEPGQERVARGVAVGVVVGLEAVEVEEQQEQRALWSDVDDLLVQVVHQRSAVARVAPFQRFLVTRRNPPSWALDRFFRPA